MALPQIREDETYTVGDYLAWDDGERWELIDGHPFLMSPAPLVDHQRVVVGLLSQLGEYFDPENEEAPGCEALLSPLDVFLPEAGESLEESKTVVQPDLVVVCDPETITPKGVVGGPDWVIEVVSPSTSARDQSVKRDLYERHGVKEYWLVHPLDRVLTVYRRDGDEGFVAKPEISETEGTSSPHLFPELEIDWERVFARVTPRD